ncbi:MAG: hypothetical protein CMH52_07690 [Myxococcales bacterium]|nr:hypothetical protein [Myxococcales bacterium]
MKRALLFLLLATSILSCRNQIGSPCKKKGDCALGLYCDLERELCDDRGKLLKKKAEKIYIYPIPPKTTPAQPKVAPLNGP